MMTWIMESSIDQEFDNQIRTALRENHEKFNFPHSVHDQVLEKIDEENKERHFLERILHCFHRIFQS